MKKTQKKLLGFLGLVLVVATTIFAAFLPSPEVSAMVTGVTDTITVRVVGAVPLAKINSPENGAEYLYPEHVLSFIYENIETVTATMRYKDKDGVEHTYLLDEIFADYNVGSKSIDLNLAESPLGYGEYTITVSGSSLEGVPSEDIVSFGYYPVVGSIEESDDSDNATLNYDYDETNDEIKNLQVKIYDADGNIVATLPLISVPGASGKLELPFVTDNYPAGTYTITISALDGDGNVIYLPYKMTYEYEDVKVPNTGALFNNLNISQSDYLITGLIVFFLIGFGGLFFIARDRKGQRRR